MAAAMPLTRPCETQVRGSSEGVSDTHRNTVANESPAKLGRNRSMCSLRIIDHLLAQFEGDSKTGRTARSARRNARQAPSPTGDRALGRTVEVTSDNGRFPWERRCRSWTGMPG